MRPPAVAYLTRAVVGAVLVAQAPRVVRARTGDGVEPAGSVLLARALGAREVVQGCAGVLRPSATVFGVGAAADALHLATMVVPSRSGSAYHRLARPALAMAALDLVTSLFGVRRAGG